MKIVILDNGHGQETPGKRSPVWSDGKQLFEGNLTGILSAELRIYWKPKKYRCKQKPKHKNNGGVIYNDTGLNFYCHIVSQTGVVIVTIPVFAFEPKRSP